MTEPIRQAIVLAGGKGTRLGALTAETPKPLLPVAGRPFVEWVVDNLTRHGVSDVVLTVGYRAEAFDGWVAGWSGAASVSVFVEEEPLDTGGALTLLGDRLDERFYALNGDTLFDAPIRTLGDALHTSDADVAIALRRLDETGRYGRVALSGTRVVDFAEKAGGGPGLVNGGIYAMRRSVVEGRTAPLSIERDLLPDAVREGRVVGLPSDGFFIDIGVPETFEEAQRSVPEWWSTSGG